MIAPLGFHNGKGMFSIETRLAKIKNMKTWFSITLVNPCCPFENQSLGVKLQEHFLSAFKKTAVYLKSQTIFCMRVSIKTV